MSNSHKTHYLIGQLTRPENMSFKNISFGRTELQGGNSYFIVRPGFIIDNYHVLYISKVKKEEYVRILEENNVKEIKYNNLMYKPIFLAIDVVNNNFIIQYKVSIMNENQINKYLPELLREYYNESMDIRLKSMDNDLDDIAKQLTWISHVSFKYSLPNPHSLDDKAEKAYEALRKKKAKRAYEAYDSEEMPQDNPSANTGGLDLVSEESVLRPKLAAAKDKKYGKGGSIEGYDDKGHKIKLSNIREDGKALIYEDDKYIDIENREEILELLERVRILIRNNIN